MEIKSEITYTSGHVAPSTKYSGSDTYTIYMTAEELEEMYRKGKKKKKQEEEWNDSEI